MLLTFAATLFLSAGLLFLVQPMVGKMITPLLGGTPAVWNTCMVFFQALLLGGYAYAHVTTSWLGARKQAVLHLLVMLTAFAFFPLAINRGQLADTWHPVVAVLAVLAVSLGVPFFVVSSSAPLLQRWFSRTDHSAAKDPYFLYGASNFGSMLALLAYPTVVEPLLPLAWQRGAWCVGYGLLVVLAGACAVFMWTSAPAPVGSDAPLAQAAPDEPAGKPKRQKSRGRPAQPPESKPPGQPAVEAGPAARPSWARRLRWVALAAVPSSLLLAATTYITTDVASVPLLWVAPLALYILSFILVFARTPIVPHRLAVAALPPLVLLLLFLLITNLRPGGIGGVITLHLLVMFVAALVCHGELAADRPPPQSLTEFYLLMSAGGVVGGLFNSVLAPLVFRSLSEYELALLVLCALAPPPPGAPRRWVGCLAGGLLAVLLVISLPLAIMNLMSNPLRFDFWLQPQWDLVFTGLALALALGLGYFRRAERSSREVWLDALSPLAMGVLVTALMWSTLADAVYPHLAALAARLGVRTATVGLAVGIGLPTVLCYSFVGRPARFVLAVDALLVAALFNSAISEPPGLIVQKRGFFGVLRVQGTWVRSPDGGPTLLVSLRHGTTLHGSQFRDPVHELRDQHLRAQPLAYFHRSGPIGQVFAAYNHATRPYGVIGLGAGSLAAYALPDQQVDFYEIDPLVRDLAFTEEGAFSFVTDAQRRGARLQLLMGDARLVLERELAGGVGRYGLLVVDAFSSDAIPVHLLTREALRVYLKWLLDDGILCFHTSNDYLDLRPVLANLAEAEGLTGYVLNDPAGAEARRSGRTASQWIVMARQRGDLRRLPLGEEPNPRAAEPGAEMPEGSLPAWRPLRPSARVGVWTDDYSNLWRVFKNFLAQRQ
jgi:hypothetical protein